MDIIEHRDEHGITLTIDRSLDLTSAGELDKALGTHLGGGDDAVWIDIRGVQSVDSAGLTLFLKWHRIALARGRRLAIVRTSEFHRKLFEITRLDAEVLVYDVPGGRRILGRAVRMSRAASEGLLGELSTVL